ncbi:phospholipase A [Sphingomonas sp. CJ20]
MRAPLFPPALTIACLCAAAPAMAQVRAVPAQPDSEQAALRGVEVFLVNEGPAPIPAEGPRQIEVTAADGTRLVLERTPGPVAVLAPGSFVKARYVPVGIAGVQVAPAAQHAAAPTPSDETIVQSSTGAASVFLDRFAPHEPIYGAFGTGDAGGKVQFSFAFRPFAESAPLKLANLRFAYTQTMFWAINEPSGPFRATNYSPEIYAEVPFDDSTQVALGWRHDSNGGDGLHSVDLNRIFARVEKRFDLGDDWRLDIAPQAWFYVGHAGNARDVAEYFGYTALTAAIQQANGIKLSVTARGNVETRRGAAELFVSYPLSRIGGLGVYLFGQAFTGHGEVLSDYTRRDTHARLGIALTR